MSTTPPSRGHKRRHSDSRSAAEHPMKKQAPSAAKPKSKRSQNEHKLPRVSVPENAIILEKCLQLHCRILWKALDPKQPPPLPTDHALRTFRARFTSHDEIQTLIDNIAYTGFDTSTEIRDFRMHSAIKAGAVARDAARVSDYALQTMFAMVAAYGLQTWCPDLLGSTPTSLYNAAHEMIAIHSFQLVAGSGHAYSFKKINQTHMEDIGLLTKMYRNFVFSSEKGKVIKEAREAGSVASGKEKTDTYKRRRRLALDRTDFLRGEGMSARVLSLFDEPAANSDDEQVLVDQKYTYYVLPKEARGESVALLARSVDTARLEMAELQGRGKFHKQRSRTPAPAGYTKQSISKHLPSNTTLDWFAPAFFNRLPAAFRVRYRDADIALPLASRLNEDPGQDWKTMEYKDFMAKYGDEVKAQYKLPSDEEVEAMEAATDEYFADEDEDMDEE